MRIWQSPDGQFHRDQKSAGGTKAKPVDFDNKTKEGVLGLLNQLQSSAPGRAKSTEPEPVELDPLVYGFPDEEDAPGRWRVFCRGLFCGVVRASNSKEAIEAILPDLKARRSTAD